MTALSIPTRNCPHCKKFGQVPVTPEQFWKWSEWNKGEGGLIQDALPSLSPALREQLMTGLHPGCFDAYLGEEE